jgi:hypothetical protein
VGWTGPGGQAVLLADEEKVHQIVSALFEDKTDGTGSVTTDGAAATPEPVNVQIQNGTGTEGLAASVMGFIAGKGYPQGDLNATNVFDGRSHATSEILDLDGTHQRNAYILASWLNIPVSQVRDATAAERAAMSVAAPADIVIVLGSDVNFEDLIQSPTTSVPGG